MENKKKLIKKGLIDLFPKEITTFVDAFAGSAVVAMNVQADKYIVNDIDSNLLNCISYLQRPRIYGEKQSGFPRFKALSKTISSKKSYDANYTVYDSGI